MRGVVVRGVVIRECASFQGAGVRGVVVRGVVIREGGSVGGAAVRDVVVQGVGVRCTVVGGAGVLVEMLGFWTLSSSGKFDYHEKFNSLHVLCSH